MYRVLFLVFFLGCSNSKDVVKEDLNKRRYTRVQVDDLSKYSSLYFKKDKDSIVFKYRDSDMDKEENRLDKEKDKSKRDSDKEEGKNALKSNWFTRFVSWLGL